MRFLIIPNLSKKDAIAFTASLLQTLAQKGHPAFMEPCAAAYFPGLPVLPFDKNADAPKPDAAILLGGDGTILQSVPLLCALSMPLLGVNFGQVGYLAECAPEAFPRYLAAILDGSARTEERILLEGTACSSDGEKHSFTALNEAVLHRGGMARALHTEIYYGGRHLGKFSSDGIIISTPTGSTAYNLSAGGPILLPEMKCLAITPIAPGSPMSAPVVVDATEEILIRLPAPRRHEKEAESSVALTVDGCRYLPLAGECSLRFSAAKRSLRMYSLENDRLCRILHGKFSHGGLILI